MVFTQTRIYSRKWDALKLLELWGTNGFANLGQKTTPSFDLQEKQRIYHQVDFTVPAEHRELKEKDIYDNFLLKLHFIFNQKYLYFIISSRTIIPLKQILFDIIIYFTIGMHGKLSYNRNTL